MKFHFTVQPYQTDAVEAVARVFEGQPDPMRTGYPRGVGGKRVRYEKEGGG